MDAQAELRELLRRRPLVVVSNREPYVHRRGPAGLAASPLPGGLVAALDPALKAAGGTWVALGSGDADWEAADARGRLRVPPEAPAYLLRRVRLPESVERGYYLGTANSALWPLCHVTPEAPVFRAADWEAYREANLRFAEAAAEEAGEGALVFLQDYHLALAPAALRAARPGLRLGQFWHVPWPPLERLRLCPQRRELLEGLLANDLLGFQVRDFCREFVRACEAELGARVEGDAVLHAGRRTVVRPFPISIDYRAAAAEADGAEARAALAGLRARLGVPAGAALAVGVDRLDYTKGIPERLEALGRLLERRPEHRGRLLYAGFGSLSRVELPAYRELARRVEARAKELNERWGKGGRGPVRLELRDLPRPELLALYRGADLCVVSSLHDGMNLVAKEFVAAQADLRGVLVLSKETGAARELEEALIMDPRDPDGFAEALHRALAMPAEEKRRRMEALRERVRRNDVFRWAADVLRALDGL